jgi:glycosyltransferase involved in cell wall biosynthesis
VSRRAVVVSPDPSNAAGGTERFCSALAGLLGQLGFDAAIVGPSGKGPGWVERHGGGHLWQAASVPREVQTACGPHVELVVTCGHLGWPGRWAERRVHVYVGNLARLSRHVDGYWHWRLRWGAAGGLAEALAARGALAVAISDEAAEDARRLYRARVDAVLPLGVDTDVFRPRDRREARRRLELDADGRYALFVGRGEPGKGPDVALEASRRSGFELLAAGARPVAGSRALGVLCQDELAWAYAAVDAVVLPTHYEGFGYAAVEAVACGVPLVTTPTGWARDLARDVPAYRPWLVPPEPTAVAAALERTWSDGTSARAAAVAARQYVLVHNTVAAFERRWTDWLAGAGLLA